MVKNGGAEKPKTRDRISHSGAVPGIRIRRKKKKGGGSRGRSVLGTYLLQSGIADRVLSETVRKKGEIK